MTEFWQLIGGLAIAVVVVTGAIAGIVRKLLRSEFVPRSQHDELQDRVHGLEKHMAAMPSGRDLIGMTERLGSVERDVAVVRTMAEGINAGTKRVEHTVGLLLQHQLNKGDA